MTHTELTEAILREEEFAQSLDTASQAFGAELAAFIADVEAPRREDGHLVRLAEEALRLETFLDDHGARQNRTFVVFRELVASVRWLSRVLLCQQHLAHRMHRYDLLIGSDSAFKDLGAAGVVLSRSLQSLGAALVSSAAGLGIRWTETARPLSAAAWRQRQLPRNLDADTSGDESDHLPTLATRLLTVIKASRALGLERKRPESELTGFVRDHATEDRCRWYESAVHNIQSMYDTHVLGTTTETEHPWLRQVRGHASVAYHLLEMATDLIHFYERHENDVRHEPAREAVAEHVPSAAILNVAVNTCMHHAFLFVDEASVLAERLLETFLTQREMVLSLPEGITLHARPLALIVQVAKHHKTPIDVTIRGQTCSAASLMGLIMLAGQFPDAREIAVRGDDQALQDLRLLFESGLGEQGDLPGSLGYLTA